MKNNNIFIVVNKLITHEVCNFLSQNHNKKTQFNFAAHFTIVVIVTIRFFDSLETTYTFTCSLLRHFEVHIIVVEYDISISYYFHAEIFYLFCP